MVKEPEPIPTPGSDKAFSDKAFFVFICFLTLIAIAITCLNVVRADPTCEAKFILEILVIVALTASLTSGVLIAITLVCKNLHFMLKKIIEIISIALLCYGLVSLIVIPVILDIASPFESCNSHDNESIAI